MAAASEESSDWSILTSDNPRSEDSARILADMRAGLSTNRYEEIADRTEAIRKAVKLAGPGDIILIAGKGHEAYQEFADRKIPFNDCSVALRAIEERRVNIDTERGPRDEARDARNASHSQRREP
jgi:UDP-N-acetylmuramoyl-L-alanyl-D-glutamate--2,6-diaminopimelate ligase